VKNYLFKFFVLLVVISNFSYGFVITATELFEKLYIQSRYIFIANKVGFSKNLLKNSFRVQNLTSLSKSERIKLYLEFANISQTKQIIYLRRFNQIENGDKILINAIKNNRNLDDVFKDIGKKSIPTRRRITNLEKELLLSNGARKDYLFGRSVVKRNIFQCTKENIALMKKGLAPFGNDGYKVNLHHLKQQKNGALVELTQTEHNRHSAVLHRYVKTGSEITDRNRDFQIFKRWYWKSRAVDCIAKTK